MSRNYPFSLLVRLDRGSLPSETLKSGSTTPILKIRSPAIIEGFRRNILTASLLSAKNESEYEIEGGTDYGY